MSERVGIAGRHAVLQALRSSREVHSVLVARDQAADPRLRDITLEAARRGLVVNYVLPGDLVRIAGSGLQGVAAIVEPLPEHSVKDLVEQARAAGEEPFVVAVDGVEDPQNLGAIARSALLAGAHGLIVPERGTASIGQGALKSAAGAFSMLPVARVGNLATALSTLRREGVWIVGADANGGKAPWDLRLTGAVCLVLGSESEGLSRGSLEALDARVCIPTPGGDLSLNVAAAAAALCFERVRQASVR
ncbi:MAG: rRNA (guanosine2251-2-O)-methyltransferase [Thermoplasmata archaeon]|jgi:23S rRNA (guanosine2251-2'-O)-methyltransferase|nr:rRNA (guanosine2251-2-O)-methyltransferase [Thermoplasmata archaeon]